MADRKSNPSRCFPSTATGQTQTETDHIIRLAIEVGRLQAELERAQASEQAALRMYTQLQADVEADEDLPVAISADTKPKPATSRGYPALRDASNCSLADSATAADHRHISADTITAGRIEARAIVLTDSAGTVRALLETQNGMDGREETSFALFDKHGDLRLTMKAQAREATLNISSGATVKEWVNRIIIGYDPHTTNGIRVSDASGEDVALLTEASNWHRLDEDEAA